MSTTLADRSPAGLPGPARRPDRTPGWATRWRVALRLAWREVRRAKGRTALVIALIAVPVGAMVFADVLIRSGNLTERERAMVALGSVADARFAAYGTSDGEPPPLPLERSPHADVVEVYFGRVRLGPKYHDVKVTVADLASPLLRGAYDMTTGNPPLTTDEAAVSVAAAESFDVRVGDKIRLLRSGQEWTVSGIYRGADQVGEGGVIVRQAPTGIGLTAATTYRYVSASPAALREAVTTSSPFATLRDASLSERFPADDGAERLLPVLGIYAGGIIGLFVTGIVVSAAFAAGARRQLRTMGLAAASGASPAYVRRTLVGQGLLCGVLGTLTGFALGAGGVAAIAPRLDRMLGFVLPGLHVRAFDLGLVALLAGATAMISAAVPAAGLSRVPVLAALAGRRPVRPAANAVPLVGVALFGLGLAALAVSAGLPSNGSGSVQLLLLYSGASLAILLGAVLSTPWIVGRFEHVSGRLRGPARLAARAMARSRSRTGPIAAAIVVTMGLAGFVSIIAATTVSYDTAITAGQQPNTIVVSSSFGVTGGDAALVPSSPIGSDASIVGRVTAIVPGAVVFSERQLVTPAERNSSTPSDSWTVAPADASATAASARDPAGELVTSDRAALATIGVPPDAIDAWHQGTALVLGPGAVDQGRVALRHLATAGTSEADRTELIPARELPVLAGSARVAAFGCDSTGACSAVAPTPLVVLPDEVVARLGLVQSPNSATTVRARAPLTPMQRAALRQLNRDLIDEATTAAEAGEVAPQAYLQFVDDDRPSDLWQGLLLAAAAFAALGVTAVGLSLSAAEARAEDATFVALGAPARFRRSVRAWEALFTTAIGSVLGVPLGVLVGVVFQRSSRRDPTRLVHLHLPWPTLLGLGLGLPVVAALVFWLCTWPRRAVLLRDD